MTVTLEELPDYPAIQQIQSALWQLGSLRGAAVMVGSGFSRLALRASEAAPLPPLWSDFRREMGLALGYLDTASFDTLKLAQEFEVALGSSALDALIRSLVRDDEWLPGSHHERLLGLPWADVLTTNWDTLLERTEIDPDGPQYQVVRTVADIARTRAPRIVKLHGSLPSHKPFIFTEEDFRKYPEDFRPFVNTAQQVLLENELCLVGFSGDDPNFIRWAGWVRDQLGISARRIRLIDVLDIAPSRRQLLEQQNVSVIDLSPLVANVDPARRHAVALEIFLDGLWAAKPAPPHAWTRNEREHVGTAGPDEQQIDTLAADWKADRLAYPGWIVAPPGERERLRYETDRDFRTLFKAFTAADSQEAIGGLLREALWRHEISFWPLSAPIEEVATSFFASESRGGLSQAAQAEMLSFLASEARRRRAWDAFDRWIALLEFNVADDVGARAAYEKALRARDELDFDAIAPLVESVRGRDPIWTLRRASLIMELGEPVRAARTVREARQIIQTRRRLDPSAIWLLSRQAWTHWVWQSAQWELRKLDGDDRGPPIDWDWPIRYRANETDPWDEMRAADVHIQSELAEVRKDSRDDRRSKFDPGVYSKTSQGIRYTSHAVVGSADELSRLADRIGLPRSIGMSDVIGSRIAYALEVKLDLAEADLWLAARYLTSATEGLINEQFGRLQISRLSLDLVRSLAAALASTIEFGLPRLERASDGSGQWRSPWLDRCIRWTELLSRLVVRLPPDEAMAMWRKGVTLAHDRRWSHWWLFKPLSNLLRRSLEAIPPARRNEIGLDVITLPLPGEFEITGQERDWPELIGHLVKGELRRDFSDTAWSSRISTLIHLVGIGEQLTRSRAVWRLMVLHQADGLTSMEQSAFAESLWSRLREDGMPGDLELYDHVVLHCPEPASEHAATTFRNAVYGRIADSGWSDADLIAASQAADESNTMPCFPIPAQALAAFRQLLAWKPRPARDDRCGYDFPFDRQRESAIGSCLAYAVMPTLAPELVSEDDRSRWREAFLDPQRPSMLRTGAQAARIWPAETDLIVSRTRKALASSDQILAQVGLECVHKFQRLARQSGGAVPRILAADIVTSCAIRREPGLSWSLQCARQLLNDGVLNKEDQELLISGLEFLLTETTYANWTASDARTPSLGLVRRECVRLSNALVKAGREHDTLQAWLAVATDDPAPEVRFALSEMNGAIDGEQG